MFQLFFVALWYLIVSFGVVHNIIVALNLEIAHMSEKIPFQIDWEG